VNAEFFVRLHAIAAVAWIFPGVLVALFIVYGIEDQRASALAILLVSLYANAVGHASAYQASRAERKADARD
jgi:hypothetical protein